MSTIIDEANPLPKYHQLRDFLREQIDSGRFKIGDRIPTEMELAELCRMNRLTVRQGIMDLVNEGILCRRPGLGTFVTRRKSRPAETRTEEKQSRTIAVALESIDYINIYYFTAIAKGIGKVLVDQGYDLNIATTKSDADKFSEMRGVIIIDQLIPDERVLEIAQNVPVVLVDRVLEHPNISSIAVDNRHGAFTATEYLINLGHRSIAFFVANLQFFSTQQMVRGIQDALKKHEMPFQNSPIEELVHADPEYFTLRAIKIMKEFAPTAFFCLGDEEACLLMKTLRDIGYNVPDDVSVIGYNDTPVGSLVTPPLTSVKVQLVELGRECGKALIPMLEGGRGKTKWLQPRLIIRKSTATAREGSLEH